MAIKRTRKRRLWDPHAFKGFRPEATVSGVLGAPKARVITLVRRAKNTLWCLWHAAPPLVRPQDAWGPRPVERGYTCLSGTRGPTGRLSTLRQGETRAAGFPGRQSVLYQVTCLVSPDHFNLGEQPPEPLLKCNRLFGAVYRLSH